MHQTLLLRTFMSVFQISYIPYESGFVVSGGECTLKDIRQAVSSVANEYRIPFSMHIAMRDWFFYVFMGILENP